MTTIQRFPVQVWTASDLRSLKWGSVLVGVGVGLFLPRGFRRYGRVIALGAAAFAIKPLMNLLREDSVITLDRPWHGDAHATGATATSLEGAEAAD